MVPIFLVLALFSEKVEQLGAIVRASGVLVRLSFATVTRRQVRILQSMKIRHDHRPMIAYLRIDEIVHLIEIVRTQCRQQGIEIVHVEILVGALCRGHCTSCSSSSEK